MVLPLTSCPAVTCGSGSSETPQPRSLSACIQQIYWRELHAPCAHRARTLQSFDICVFMGTVFPPLPGSTAPGSGMVDCVGVLVTKSFLCLPIIVRCSVLNGHVCCPPACIYHVFVLGHPRYPCLLQSREHRLSSTSNCAGFLTAGVNMSGNWDAGTHRKHQTRN